MAGPTLFRPIHIPSGLKGYWKLDETSGSRADSSGNSNTLTDNNTVTEDTTDYWGLGEGAADFEATNSEYLSITDGSQTGLDMTGAFSIRFQVKFESLSGQYLVTKYDGSTGYRVFLESTSQIRFMINTASGTQDLLGTLVVVANRWYDVACVYDGSYMLIYIDGNLDKCAVNTSNPSGNASSFLVGQYAAGNYFDGRMKDLAIWNVGITPLQVKSLAMGVDLSTKSYRPDHADLASGLVSYWKLNERGNPATNFNRNDSVGANHLGANGVVPSGVGFVEGVGAHFDGDPHGGVLDYLSIAHASQTGLDQDSADASMTFAIWVKPDAIESTDGIAGKVVSNADEEGWVATINSSGKVNFYCQRGTGTMISTATGLISTSAWYHLAFVYDASNDTMYIYVDGKLAASGTHTYGIGDNGGQFIIGANSGAVSGADFFSGDMCDAAFWNVALPAAKIQKLAQAFDIQRQQLVSYWKLDETSGTRLDTIGDNDLTDNNTVLSGTGLVDTAADFESTNSEYLSIADASQSGLDITRDMTMIAAVRFESLGGSTSILDKNGRSGGTGYSIGKAGTGEFDVYVQGTQLKMAVSPSTATWYVVAGTFTGAKLIGYTNGTPGGDANLSTAPADNAVAFALGRRGDAASEYFDGLMDEVAIFSRYLRDEEVKVLYARTLNGKAITLELAANEDGGGMLMAAA